MSAYLLGTTILFAGAGMASAAFAQSSAGAGANDGVLDEVVVTAGKRTQRIVDVPYGITAVGGKEITDRGALDIKDLQYSVPSLQISPAGAGADRIAMRGVNAGVGTGQPIVGVYVDEVGISTDQQQRDGAFPLVDIDRVEVLRGPQGTLYGQASVVGAIRFITHNPSLSKVDGFFEGSVYDQDAGGVGYHVNGAVSLPLIKDQLGVRIVAGYDDRAGWIDYPNAGVKNANERDTYFVRTKFLWEPSADLKVSLLYQYYDLKSNTTDIATDNSYNYNNGFYLFPASDISHTANLIGDYDLGWATLTASTGYQFRDLTQEYPLPFPGVGEESKYKQFTEEVRLTSKGAGPFSYVVGAWYRSFRSPSRFYAPDFLSFLRFTGTDPANSDAYAVFGDGTYTFDSHWAVSMGLRYYQDWRKTEDSNSPPSSASFHSISPRFNVQYKWNSDISSYFQLAKGFRSGGFNSNTTAVPTYGPESMWSYELGAKAELFGGRIYLDAAVYYEDYKDRQEAGIEIIDGVGITVTQNAGAASGVGAELAATAILPWNVHLDATASYNDVTYSTTTQGGVPGQRFIGVPPFTGSISLNQTFPVSSNLKGFWRVDYQHTDGTFTIFRTQAGSGYMVLAQAQTRAADTFNLRTGLDFGDKTITLYVDNLTNVTRPIYPYIAAAGPVTTNITQHPRTIGATLRWNFN